jgi:hypothetical protein
VRRNPGPQRFDDRERSLRVAIRGAQLTTIALESSDRVQDRGFARGVAYFTCDAERIGEQDITAIAIADTAA